MAAALIGGILAGNGAIFAQIEGIEGESKAVNREGWMDITGLGSRVFLETDVTTGRTGSIPIAEEFIFRKKIDQASPYLLEASLKGTVLPELQVEQTANGEVVGCYRLRGASLTRLQLRSLAGETQLEEELGFSYDVIEWHYFRASNAGGQSHFGSTWDFAVNAGGILNQHGTQAPSISPIGPIQMKPGGTVEIPIQLLDPSGHPEDLVFSALSPENSLIKVLGITGKGLTRTLTLAANVLLNGPDSLTLNVSDGTRSSTRILPVLVAGERTPYEAYVEGFLGDQAKLDPEILGLLQDPDNDDMSNLMEFFLGTNPASHTRNDQAFTFAREKTKTGTEIRMTYFRRTNPGGLTEKFEGSQSLRKWIALNAKTNPAIEINELPGGTKEYLPMEARVLIPFDSKEPSGETYYMRLAVEGSF